jgi:hypothetical protein
MKIILGIIITLFGSYFLLNWAGENPRDARKITRQVDSATSDLVDKGQRAVEELKK